MVLERIITFNWLDSFAVQILKFLLEFKMRIPYPIINYDAMQFKNISVKEFSSSGDADSLINKKICIAYWRITLQVDPVTLMPTVQGGT